VIVVVAVRFALQELRRHYFIRNTFHTVCSEEIGFGVGLDLVDQVLEDSVRVREDIVGIAAGDLLVENRDVKFPHCRQYSLLGRSELLFERFPFSRRYFRQLPACLPVSNQPPHHQRKCMVSPSLFQVALAGPPLQNAGRSSRLPQV